MTGYDMPSVFVNKLASAETLDSLPSLADASSRAPLNPPEIIQLQFVGASYVDAYTEAERFVDRAFECWPDGDASTHSVLDFGSGWGRIGRMLLRRFSADRIWASDVDVQMSALIQSTLPGINAVTNDSLPPSSFRTNMFDAVTAFSVFSHLSERSHRAWATEFGRITRAGGKVFITVLEPVFIEQVAVAQELVAQRDANDFAIHLSTALTDVRVARNHARQGKFVYANGGADTDGPRAREFYAWAVAPRYWVTKVWGNAGFRVESWIPTGELFEQAMVVLERKKGARFRPPSIRAARQAAIRAQARWRAATGRI